MRARLLLTVICLASACADSDPPMSGTDANVMDAGTADVPSQSDAGGDAGPTPEGLFVRVYTDEGADDRTRRRNGFDADDTPIAGHNVRAFDATGPREATTGTDGIARFGRFLSGRVWWRGSSGDAARGSRSLTRLILLPNAARLMGGRRSDA